MSGRSGVSVRQRRVSAELREWRKKAGLTCKQVADALDVSVAKVSRMETGERGLFADDVSALLGLYRVPQQRRAELLEMVRNCHEPNWWNFDQPAVWREIVDFERRSRKIVGFESMYVPGPAQTDEYASAVLYGILPSPSDSEVQQIVGGRMARTSLLATAQPPTLHLIVDESVLVRPVGGPAVMARQLDHLLHFSRRQTVTVQVVPFAAGATPGLAGPTFLYDLRDGTSVICEETRTTCGFVSDPQAVSRARVALRTLEKVALAPTESARLISAAANKFRSEEV